MEYAAPVEPVDFSATLAEIRAAREHNARVGVAFDQMMDLQKTIDAQIEKLHQTRAEIARLQRDAEELERGIAAKNAALGATDIPEAIDLTPLEQRLEEAEAINAQHRAYVERQAAVRAVEMKELEAQALTDRLAARDAERAAVIQAAAFPVPGIGLTEDGVTLNGLPLDQASSAEQLRLSAAIGMALNPQLRVMVIRDGSLLDEDSLQLLTEAAAAEDFVLLVETVDTSGQVGIYIEDGEVVAIHGQAVTA
jgi:hypothetical protein